jgi:hypothetical protein
LISHRNSLLGLVVLLAALVMLAAGCGGQGKPGVSTEPAPLTDQLWPAEDLETEPVPWRPGCSVLAGPTRPGGDFTVLLTDNVIPGRAPLPHNSSERLVFAQLYETLVQVSCDGRILPGLAEHWACTEDSTVWVFTLRQGARFWDGTRVTPLEVKQAWASSQDCPETGNQSSPWSWLSARSSSIKALDALRLAVSLPEPQAEFPTLLAHPATAVAVRREGWTWPVGSGPCRLRASTPAPLPRLSTRPNPHHPAAPTWRSLDFVVRPDSDPRDLATSSFDLMLVRDRQVQDFFHQVPDRVTLPLPWDRLYLLVINPDQNPDGGAGWRNTAHKLNPTRDLTVHDSRPWPELIFPSGPGVSCPQLTGPVPSRQSADRNWDLPAHQLNAETLVCADGDPAARELAERLGGLHGTPSRIVSLSPPAAAFTLQWQMAGAQILRLDQQFPTRCLQKACLLSRAAWIQRAALSAGGDHALSRYLQPLALTRPWLVARPGLAGLSLDYDGTPLLHGLGEAQAAATGDLP